MSMLIRFLAAAALACASFAIVAAPVEYVRVCSDYGSGYSYLPGTDVCVNTFTGETRMATEGGLWRAHVERLPGEWFGLPRAACPLGRVVPMGTITPADLTQNAFGQFETAALPLVLGPNQFVSKVLFRGGFNATSRSNFCLAFKDGVTNEYSVLGCHDTAGLRDQRAVWGFSPLRTVPPETFTGTTLVGANGNERWPILTPFEGSLECWVCVQGSRR